MPSYCQEVAPKPKLTFGGMPRLSFNRTFEKNLFHDKVLCGYVFVEFPIEWEFNLAASEDIIILIEACVNNMMSTTAFEKIAYLFDIPKHDLRSPDIFVSIVVLFLSLISIRVVDCTGCNTIMLRCDVCDYFSFLGELAENSTSMFRSSTKIHTIVNARNVPHDGRPAGCY